LVESINVILNDALVQGQEGGLQIAYDITNPDQPFEMWRLPTIDINPATGFRYNSGVSAGSSLAVDYHRGHLFGGTGQNTTAPYDGYPDPVLAPEGYVDRSDSLYAVDFNTGEFVWTNQFHAGDVFNLNAPVSTGPNRPDGPRDADVLSPPVLFSARIKGHRMDLVGNGSKGGLFRAGMNGGTLIHKGMVYVPYGTQNHPSGGIIAYEVNHRPRAADDTVKVSGSAAEPGPSKLALSWF
jgi:hypothetical protein